MDWVNVVKSHGRSQMFFSDDFQKEPISTYIIRFDSPVYQREIFNALMRGKCRAGFSVAPFNEMVALDSFDAKGCDN